MLTPDNSVNFGCGAVGKAASDCVGGPTEESKEGSVTTTLGVVISQYDTATSRTFLKGRTTSSLLYKD